MMQQEFEKLIGHEISVDEYEKVEKVYMECGAITKQCVAEIYSLNSAYVTEILYSHAVDFEKRSEHAEYFACRNAELIAENEILQNKLDKQCETIEELQTQLHQYKTLFHDIEKNMTVSLYSTLLGITR